MQGYIIHPQTGGPARRPILCKNHHDSGDNVTKDTTAPLRVCLIEDNEPLREELQFGLRHLGFLVDGFASAEAFYRGMIGSEWDIVVADVGLPGEDGLSLVGHLRQTERTEHMGLVMLTARGGIEDRRQGSAVADLYFVKPVDLVELGAALTNLGRRVRGARWSQSVAGPQAAEAAPAGEWTLVDDGWTLVSPARLRLSLTVSERVFLGELVASPVTPVSREVLAQALGGDPYEFDFHRLDTLASRLRKKALDQGITLPLRAVRGVGYLFG